MNLELRNITNKNMLKHISFVIIEDTVFIVVVFIYKKVGIKNNADDLPNKVLLVITPLKVLVAILLQPA